MWKIDLLLLPLMWVSSHQSPTVVLQTKLLTSQVYQRRASWRTIYLDGRRWRCYHSNLRWDVCGFDSSCAHAASRPHRTSHFRRNFYVE